ncbi:MAG: FAD-binding oxidoreductase [Bacteroidia bacterium]|nr:FAD-binding oxidoreductase [Bacteroidia bacterium]MCX7652093.1 FAD-binding oxidoreductase [Bacteroidia bacterium]MDW8417120.1 FAD-binding oxidoreductase [Bacteroidia bacterium]
MELTGWGRYLRSRTYALRYSGQITAAGIPRGLGRSYGDASFYGQGQTWLMRPHRAIISWEGDVLIAEAGLSLYEILRHIVPKGWFLPVVPGTQLVTLGGSFASNIHGKNHHAVGSFADHVAWIDLRLASGELLRLTPSEELFWATAGGMGLTGVIERLAVRLMPIQSSQVYHQVQKLPDWDAVLYAVEAGEKLAPYAVAWVDHAHPRNRGILHLGRFAEKGELRKHKLLSLPIPFTPPFSVISRLTTRVFCERYWNSQAEGTHLVPFERYFFPLDRVITWNRLWGRRGFVQLQFVVERAASLERIWAHLRAAPARSFLTVLKQLGPQRGPLAFSGPGWTLSIDLPATSEVRRFLTRVTDVVIEEKGRIYLTKDSLLLPEQARAMYPDWDSFRQLKAQIDPHQYLRSNLSDRLRLTE